MREMSTFREKTKRCVKVKVALSGMERLWPLTSAFVFVQKLDVITNDLLKRALRFTGKLGVLASEEEDAPVSESLLPFYFL